MPPPLNATSGSSVAAPIDLDRARLQAAELGGDERHSQAVLIGADGTMTTGQSTRKLPGRWTHFKAAFVGFPLIGRLNSVRQAADLVNAVQFRKDFRLAVEQRYGSQITNRVLPANAAPGKRVIVTPKKILRVVQKANRASEQTARGNTAAVNRLVAPASQRFTLMTALATRQDFFAKDFTSTDVANVSEAAESAVQDMAARMNVPADSLPPMFGTILADYERRIQYAPVEEHRKLATQCLDALDNLATVVAAQKSGARSSAAESPAPASDADVAIVSQLCAHATGASGRYSAEVAQEAWAQLRDTHDKLHRELPDAPAEVLSKVLHEVTLGGQSISPAALQNKARERLLINEMKQVFDPSNPESALWNAVILGTRKHVDAGGELPTALMSTLAKEIINDLEARVARLPEILECADHLPTLIEKTREQLIENAVNAAVGHMEALQKVKESTTLSPGQKELFLRYAEGTATQPPRRLDAVQVASFEAISGAQRRNRGTSRDPAVLFDAMVALQSTFDASVSAVLQHAETMWISRSFDGTDVEKQLIDFCTQLAVAGDDDLAVAQDPNASRLSESGTPYPLPSTANRAIPQFLKACQQSASMQIAKLAMLFGDIMRVLGRNIDEFTDESQGSNPTLSSLPPELLVRTLADPRTKPEAGGMLDERGVLLDSPATALVAGDFDPASIVNLERHEVKLEAARREGLDRMPGALQHALHGAEIILQGERLKADPASGNQRAVDLYETYLDMVPAEVGPAISACLSANALQSFATDANAAAFDPPVTSTPPRVSHEVWQDTDGSWLVRSTQVSTPMAQAGRPIQTDGVILHSLTHRIVASPDGGEPRISLADTNVVFAF